MHDFIWPLRDFLYKNFFKYHRGYDHIHDIPKIGDICKILIGFKTKLAIFKEFPIKERLSENEFRYYFEFIDGSIVHADYFLWKKTACIHWDYIEDNPDKCNKNFRPDLPTQD